MLTALLLVAFAPAQSEAALREQFTKYEFRTPVRDGTRLFTSVYVPKDAGPDKLYPILLTRTPYSCQPYGVDKFPDRLRPGPHLSKAGYIFAVQDVRGRWASEGTFENMRPHNPAKTGKECDESSDTFDTIDWLLKHVPHHNGKVGQTGVSYPGFYTVCGMIDAHPALVCASPQAPVTDWFTGDDFHHNGALFLPHCFNFMANFGKTVNGPVKKWPHPPFEHGTPDGYKFFLDLGPLKYADPKHMKGDVAFWQDVVKHGTFDAFWQARNLRPHIARVKPAVMTVGGWFDAENLFGALETFKRVEATGVPAGGNTLVMGPWVHGGWQRGDGDKLGDVSFAAKTGEWYREHVEVPFFEYHLKGKGDWKPAKAWAFETGTNQWRKFDAWPPADTRTRDYRFTAAGGLSEYPRHVGPPLEREGQPADREADEFVADPAKPVPYFPKTAIGMAKEYMTADQRFAATRPDVLVYQTPVLEKDLSVAGPIEVELWVSTTGTDADWVVKVIDVFPDDYPDPDPNPAGVRMGGYQMLVRGDIMRGKFRNSFAEPAAFEPGKPAKVKFTLPDVCHAFRPGHRLMVQVQSSWFPLVDRNPQTFCDIYSCDESAFKKQTHTVHRAAEKPSRVTLRVRP